MSRAANRSVLASTEGDRPGHRMVNLLRRPPRLTLWYQGLLMLIIAAFLMFAPMRAPAQTPIGWHWYNLPPPAVKKKLATQAAPGVPLAALSPMAQMKVLQYYMQQSLDQAVLHPNTAHLYQYVQWQNFWLAHASRFTNQWQAMYLQHPEIDYAVTHPHQNLTAPLQAARTQAANDQAIAQLAAHNGLFFFYRGANKLDQTLAPSLQAFAKQFGFALIPISVDQTVLPVFDQSQMDHGQAQALGLTHFPALLLINPHTRAVTPVNYGFISIDELKNRLRHVANHWKTEDPHV